MVIDPEPIQHRKAACFRVRFFYGRVKIMRFFADAFLAERYGNRAVVLDTVAAVSRMGGGALRHLRALPRMESDRG